MKIIILGAGQVGSTLAESLATEHNDITVIDTDAESLSRLQERLDLLTIVGNAAFPTVLKRANAEDADMLIAVTNSDEVNMVACQVAYTLFQIPTKIARIRSPAYLAYEELFGPNAIPIDVMISPEQLIMDYIRRLIAYPNALEVIDLIDQKYPLVGVRVQRKAVLCDQPLSRWRQHLPGVGVSFVGLFRGDQPVALTEAWVLQPDDEIYFMAGHADVQRLIPLFCTETLDHRRILIAGGGHIGKRLAEVLETDYQVKIIERDKKRTEALALHLERAVVLQGDITDKALLLSEDIENVDVFCAVTQLDEVNAMSAILAKRLGARTAMALVNKPAFVDIVESGDVDRVISPQQITLGSLLAHIRRGEIINVHSMRMGAVEVIEAEALGTQHTSPLVGKKIKDWVLPEGVTLGAVIRNNRALFQEPDTLIESGDRIVLFLSDKTKVHRVERLFQQELSE